MGYFKMRRVKTLHDHVIMHLKRHPNIRKSFGEPLVFPYFYGGRIYPNSADISFDMSGSKRKGKAFIRGTKRHDVWSFDNAFCVVYGVEKKSDKKIQVEISDYVGKVYKKGHLLYTGPR